MLQSKQAKKARKRIDFEELAKKAVRVLLVFAASMFVLSKFIDVKLVIFLFIAIAFNTMLQKFVLTNGLPADFELSTFATVVTTMGFGLKMGIIVAILSKLIASLATASFVADHFFMMFTYIVAAVLASMFRGADILWLGMAIVIFNNILMFVMSKNILGIDITSNLSYTLTNFIFNLLVFTTLSRFTLFLVA